MCFRSMGGAVALAVLISGVSRTAESAKEKEAAKAALQAFNDYIGAWKGDGETKIGKSEFWKEGMEWGWKFAKDGSAALQVEFKDSKAFTKGEMKYLTDKKKYQLALTGTDEKTRDFEGVIKGKYLMLTRIDPASMDKYTIKLNTTNEGALYNLEYTVQTGGKGIDKKLFIVRGKKVGASIAGAKKNECVVSGGVGTRAVMFNGKTYYVCCSGCADAFNENPKKFVEEFEKKNKK